MTVLVLCQDPAVRGVTEPATSTTGVTGGGGYTTAPGANLDEYNPFDGQPPAATTGVGSGGPQAVPQYSAQGQQHVQTSELHASVHLCQHVNQTKVFECAI